MLIHWFNEKNCPSSQLCPRAVITVEPKGKACLVYSYMQMRLIGLIPCKMSYQPHLCVKTTDYWENIQVIFGLEEAKGNKHTLLVVKKFNFTILVSKIQRSVTLKKKRLFTLEIESLILQSDILLNQIIPTCILCYISKYVISVFPPTVSNMIG